MNCLWSFFDSSTLTYLEGIVVISSDLLLLSLYLFVYCSLFFLRIHLFKSYVVVDSISVTPLALAIGESTFTLCLVKSCIVFSVFSVCETNLFIFLLHVGELYCWLFSFFYF